MNGLQVRNDQVLVEVGRDARLTFRLMPEGAPSEALELQAGHVAVAGMEPVDGVLHYAMPNALESLIVRIEGVAVPVLHRILGKLPPGIDEDELETYPFLHYLEERKTGMPWRLERWYTLAGAYLVFDSVQYFERPRAPERGTNWERLIVHLRQVVDLLAWGANRELTAEGLLLGADTK